MPLFLNHYYFISDFIRTSATIFHNIHCCVDYVWRVVTSNKFTHDRSPFARVQNNAQILCHSTRVDFI